MRSIPTWKATGLSNACGAFRTDRRTVRGAAAATREDGGAAPAPISWSRRPVRNSYDPSSKRARTRPASSRCSRHIRCANAGGHVITTGLVRGTIALPAFLFAIGGITHSGGQAGGANPMRDIPRFVAMLDSGRYDAKALVTRVVPLKDMLDAYEEVAYRTTVTAIMTGQ